MIKITPLAVKVTKTCNLYLCSLLTGMCMAVTGPTLLDLQTIVQADTKHIAFVYTARSAGYLLGSMLGGVLFDLTNKKQLIFVIFNLLNSMSTFAIPWSKTVGTLTGFMTVNGLTMGLLDTGANVCCLYLWGKDNRAVFQAMHFAYGIGAFIAPLLAAPFLSISHPEETITSMVNETLLDAPLQFLSYNSSLPTNTIPSVTYAYTIIGCIGLLITASFTLVCIVSPVDEKGQDKQENQIRPVSFTFVAILVLLNSTLLFMQTGTEVGFAQMVTTYAVKGSLKLTKTLGSYITSTFWAAFTLSRLASVFLAMKYSNRTLVVLDIMIATVGGAILLCFGVANEWALWLSSALLGAGVASLFPSAIAWVDQYITVTNKIVSLFVVGVAFGEIVVPYAISSFINEIPEVLIYEVVTSCVLSGAIILIMFLLLRNKPEKYMTKSEIIDTC